MNTIITTGHGPNCIRPVPIKSSNYIFDADANSFDELVLQQSRLVPVLVHFQSRKAEPKPQATTLLKQAVESCAGKLHLVNIEIDEQTSTPGDVFTATTSGIKLYIEGEMVTTLPGTLNEQDLRELIDHYVEGEIAGLIQVACKDFTQGKFEQAYQSLGRAALDTPGDYRLPLSIAALMGRQQRHEEALRLLLSMPQTVRKKPACARLIVEQEFAWIAQPVKQSQDLEAFVKTHPTELPAVAMLAAWYATQEQFETALEYFLQIMKTDLQFENQLGRRSIVNILSLLDEGDPLTQKFRLILRQMTN